MQSCVGVLSLPSSVFSEPDKTNNAFTHSMQECPSVHVEPDKMHCVHVRDSLCC